MSLESIRQQLGLTPEATELRRRERREQEREAERRRRTFDVAGTPFEVGTTGYGALFERLDNLAVPDGPRASKDEFTPLTKSRPRGGSSGSQGKVTPTASVRSAISRIFGIWQALSVRSTRTASCARSSGAMSCLGTRGFRRAG